MRPDRRTDALRGSGGLLAVGATTGLAALSSWVVQVVASHRLGAQGFADFMVVWGVFFGLIGCLQGVQQEVTRAVGMVQAGQPAGAGVLAGPLLLGLGGAMVVLAAGKPLLQGAFGEEWTSMSAPLAIAAVGYAGLNALGGALAGGRRWTAYALLIGSEAAVRSVLLLVLLFSGRYSGPGVAGALAAGALAVVILMPSPAVRAAFRERVDVSATGLIGRSAQSIVAAGSAALVLAGFPFLMEVTAHEPLNGEAGVLIAGVVATRAPLLLIMTAYQAAMIRRLTGEVSKIRAGTLLLARRVLLATTVVVGLTWLCGSWALRSFYGSEFGASAQTLALLALAAGFSALLFVSGAATLALGRHAAFAAGWLLNLAITIICLSTVAGPTQRVLSAVFLGPVAGLVVHGAVLTIAGRGEAWWTLERSGQRD